MSSGTTCVSGCEVVSKLGLRKGHAGKTRCLNLTAVNCLARFTLAWSWQPTPCGAWLARHSPCSSSGASAAVGGVGARGGPRGEGWLAALDHGHRGSPLLQCGGGSISCCCSLALTLGFRSRGITWGSFCLLSDTFLRGRVPRHSEQPRLTPGLCRRAPAAATSCFPVTSLGCAQVG